MSEKKKFSMYIRIVCGLLGLLGIAATIYNSLKAENFTFESKLVAIVFACSIFILVAITGSNPFETAKEAEKDS